MIDTLVEIVLEKFHFQKVISVRKCTDRMVRIPRDICCDNWDCKSFKHWRNKYFWISTNVWLYKPLIYRARSSFFKASHLNHIKEYSTKRICCFYRENCELDNFALKIKRKTTNLCLILVNIVETLRRNHNGNE